MPEPELFYRYYDVLYQRKDYASEVNLAIVLSKRYGLSSPKRVLEIGCGTGNHTILLADKTKEVVTIDIDPKMIGLAQEKVKKLGKKNIKILYTPIEELDEKNFELAVALFNVVTYIPPDTRKLASFMKGVSRSLLPGAVFVFDCWNGVAVIKDPPIIKEVSLRYEGKKIKSKLVPKTDFFNQVTILKHSLEVQDGNSTERDSVSYTQTLWTPMEIRVAVEKSGMEIVLCSSAGQPGKKATDKDWKILFCCRKPK